MCNPITKLNEKTLPFLFAIIKLPSASVKPLNHSTKSRDKTNCSPPGNYKANWESDLYWVIEVEAFHLEDLSFTSSVLCTIGANLVWPTIGVSIKLPEAKTLRINLIKRLNSKNAKNKLPS